MSTTTDIIVVAVLSFVVQGVWAADIILNEYNAVDSNDFLGGGDAAADEAGGRASDSYFGRVKGNGGDWFELVVIKDHLDMRGWQLDIYDNGILDETLTLTRQCDLAGPAGRHDHHGFRGSAQRRQLQSRRRRLVDQRAGEQQRRRPVHREVVRSRSAPPTGSCGFATWPEQVVFGPAGEGISPATGIGGTEVFRLEDNPSATITANSTDYDDGDDFSTFGSPNRWGSRISASCVPVITPAAASIKVLAPNAVKSSQCGRHHEHQVDRARASPRPCAWSSPSTTAYSWTPVYPPNIGNTGQYKWLVPLVDSDLCLVRVSSSTTAGRQRCERHAFTIWQHLRAGLTRLASSTYACGFDLDELNRL